MKPLLCLLFLFTGIGAKAQSEAAFFTRDSASMIDIAKLVVENAKNRYQLDKVIPHYTSAEIWYRNDDKTLLRTNFKFFPDRSLALTHISGLYVDIFPFWKKYFDADAQLEEPKSKKAKEVTVPFLNGKATFYLRWVNSQMGEFRAIYDVDPTKTDK
jgi:hypothetical protein